jgi:hypothetical protein
MTKPAQQNLTPMDILARQNEAIESLLRTAELHQEQLEALRRRVSELEGVPWPDHAPPGDS